MKKFLTLFISLLILSCSSDSDELIKEATITVKFTQNWDGEEFSKSDLATTEFTNKLGTKLTIERLRYLISRITLTNGNDVVTTFDGYKLIDVEDESNLTFMAPEKISEGSYDVSFTFGFNETDNKDGIYADLNTASWNVGAMLGGGYHYMQLDGKYFDTNSNLNESFNYHTIRAADNSDPMNLITEDTSFIINLGTLTITNDAIIEIKMNIAGWFKSPNDWDLETLNTMLMPNFEAQKLMSENGKSGVFSLGDITQ